MSSILSIFNIAKSSLSANQIGIQTAANNIANAATEGYSRQEVIFTPSNPSTIRAGQVGTGVRVMDIRRIVDQFVENQITQENQGVGQFTAKKQILDIQEDLLSETKGIPINESITNFFNAAQDLINEVEGIAERSSLLTTGELLSGNFQALNTDLTKLRSDTDDLIAGAVKEINLLTEEIYGLNKDISKTELGGHDAASSRDKRQLLINKLSEKIDISFFEDASSQITITTSSGVTLVESGTFTTLSTNSDPTNDGLLDVGYTTGGGTFISIRGKIQNGELKGLLDARDINLPQTIDDIDKLSASLTNEINKLHRVGYGLDGSTGNDFFTPLKATTETVTTNTGGALIDVGTITNFAALTLDNYEIRFTSPANFDIINTDTNTTVSSNNYTSGANIDIFGIRVVISNDTGAPAANDTFKISSRKGTAGSISVAITDTQKVAASATSLTLPGDNRNIIDIQQLANIKLLNSNSHTFNSFYASSVESVGIDAQKTNKELSAQTFILEQAQFRRDSISGVSMDEELTNLIIYQRGYEASARLIRIADELLQTIINMI